MEDGISTSAGGRAPTEKRNTITSGQTPPAEEDDVMQLKADMCFYFEKHQEVRQLNLALRSRSSTPLLFFLKQKKPEALLRVLLRLARHKTIKHKFSKNLETRSRRRRRTAGPFLQTAAGFLHCDSKAKCTSATKTHGPSSGLGRRFPPARAAPMDAGSTVQQQITRGFPLQHLVNSLRGSKNPPASFTNT